MLAQEGTLYSQCQASNWGISGRTIEYTYDNNGSVETKTTRSGNTTLEVVTYTYDLQNRLKTATTDHQDGLVEHAEYAYSDSGIRLSSHTWTTQNGGSPQDDATKLFLIDPDNHTGYAQVLEEKAAATPVPTPTASYTIGDDILGQSKWNAGTSAYVNHSLLYDGHGSTRQLSSIAGSVAETYAYDAYGIELGGGAATAATSLLYSGEQYDSSLKQYYLRARYYDQSNGRFNQLDPYSGNNEDPQSLHKYAYCTGDPVNSIDPSGRFSLSGMLVTAGISGLISAIMMGSYGYAKGWSTRQILKAAGYSFLIGAAAGAVAYGFAAAIGTAAVSMGATVAEGEAVGWTTMGLIGGPPGVGLAIANLHEAYDKGDSVDRAFAVVNVGLASLAFIQAHWAAFNLTAGTTAAKISQGMMNQMAGEAAELDFIANAQANGFKVVGRGVAVKTPFGRRVIDVVIEDEHGLNWGVEVKSSIGAFRRNDAGARHQFAADRWINTSDDGVFGLGEYSHLRISGTSKILWRPK